MQYQLGGLLSEDADGRRLVMTRYPYAVFYEVDQVAELVNILTVQHAHLISMQRPEGFEARLF